MSAAKKSATKKATTQTAAPAKAKGSTIDAYIDAQDQWQQDIIRSFAALVAKAAPNATAYVKWGHPVWDQGGPFVLIKAYGAYVTIGFWRGAQLSDTDNVLEGDGAGMRYLKVKPGQTLPAALSAVVREAVTLNAKHGDPLKRG